MSALASASFARSTSSSGSAPAVNALLVRSTSRAAVWRSMRAWSSVFFDGELQLAVIDVGALDVELQAVERRLFLLQLVGELGRIDDGEHVALLDLVAGMDVEIDEARAARIERRADRGDDLALHGHIARQRAALDLGDAQPRRARRRVGRQQMRDGRRRRATTTDGDDAPTPIQITRFLRSTFGGEARSWAEVSRIMGLGLRAAGWGRVTALDSNGRAIAQSY